MPRPQKKSNGSKEITLLNELINAAWVIKRDDGFYIDITGKELVDLSLQEKFPEEAKLLRISSHGKTGGSGSILCVGRGKAGGCSFYLLTSKSTDEWSKEKSTDEWNKEKSTRKNAKALHYQELGCIKESSPVYGAFKTLFVSSDGVITSEGFECSTRARIDVGSVNSHDFSADQIRQILPERTENSTFLTKDQRKLNCFWKYWHLNLGLINKDNIQLTKDGIEIKIDQDQNSKHFCTILFNLSEERKLVLFGEEGQKYMARANDEQINGANASKPTEESMTDLVSVAFRDPNDDKKRYNFSNEKGVIVLDPCAGQFYYKGQKIYSRGRKPSHNAPNSLGDDVSSDASDDAPVVSGAGELANINQLQNVPQSPPMPVNKADLRITETSYGYLIRVDIKDLKKLSHKVIPEEAQLFRMPPAKKGASNKSTLCVGLSKNKPVFYLITDEAMACAPKDRPRGFFPDRTLLYFDDNGKLVRVSSRKLRVFFNGEIKTKHGQECKTRKNMIKKSDALRDKAESHVTASLPIVCESPIKDHPSRVSVSRDSSNGTSSQESELETFDRSEGDAVETSSSCSDEGGANEAGYDRESDDRVVNETDDDGSDDNFYNSVVVSSRALCDSPSLTDMEDASNRKRKRGGKYHVKLPKLSSQKRPKKNSNGSKEITLLNAAWVIKRDDGFYIDITGKELVDLSLQEKFPEEAKLLRISSHGKTRGSDSILCVGRGKAGGCSFYLLTEKSISNWNGESKNKKTWVLCGQRLACIKENSHVYGAFETLFVSNDGVITSEGFGCATRARIKMLSLSLHRFRDDEIRQILPERTENSTFSIKDQKKLNSFWKYWRLNSERIKKRDIQLTKDGIEIKIDQDQNSKHFCTILFNLLEERKLVLFEKEGRKHIARANDEQINGANAQDAARRADLFLATFREPNDHEKSYNFSNQETSGVIVLDPCAGQFYYNGQKIYGRMKKTSDDAPVVSGAGELANINQRQNMPQSRPRPVNGAAPRIRKELDHFFNGASSQESGLGTFDGSGRDADGTGSSCSDDGGTNETGYDRESDEEDADANTVKVSRYLKNVGFSWQSAKTDEEIDPGHDSNQYNTVVSEADVDELDENPMMAVVIQSLKRRLG